MSTGAVIDGGGIAAPDRIRRLAARQLVQRLPDQIRIVFRRHELWLLLLAAIIGAASGIAVVGMASFSQQMHRLLFATEGLELSGSRSVDPRLTVAVPALGGLVLGLANLLIGRWRRRTPIDPIEANALYGGRLSSVDGLIVAIQTILSNGCGASLGLEAGYTQVGSAMASRLGRALRVRRGDLRVLVGCGAAGAIAAAFNAPLTGAFYAFELIIGTYSIVILGPVIVAAVFGIGAMRLISTPHSLPVDFSGQLFAADYVPVVAVSLLCALLGIVIMRLVALVERSFRTSRLPIWGRPFLGGLAVGLLGLVTPAVLSSGHSALLNNFNVTLSAGFLALLIGLKVLASAISLGAGFRGGLFFASLFLGALAGKLFALGWALWPGLDVPAAVLGMVGMSALATAIVGGPLTMSFLALESSGSLPLTIAVIVGSLVSTTTVRFLFGYSFATWRFHLRGEAIRSAADIGWIRNLSVGRMMRRDIRTVRLDSSLDQLRRNFPLGSSQRLVVLDAVDGYAGLLAVSDLHIDGEGQTLADLLVQQTDFLVPQMNVRDAVAAFQATQSEALVVVDNPATRRVLGLLTEKYALRRYAEELDRRRREIVGT